MILLNNDPKERPKRAPFIKIRFVIVVLATLCPIVCYISRQNVSMAIIAMVKVKASEAHGDLAKAPVANSSGVAHLTASTTPATTLAGALGTTQTSFYDNCPWPTIVDASGNVSSQPLKTYGPRYDWSESDKSLVFEAFFWPYVICQIPGARIAERIGPHWVLMIATTGSSVISLLSPWAASIPHVYTFAFMRLLLGICQTALYPSLYVLYMKWLPTTERLQALPVAYVGAYIGSIISSASTGYFSESASFGWEYAFYTPGVLCAIWSALWFWLGSSEPKQHKYISYEEIEYIDSHIESRDSELEPKREISWWKVAKSRHVWALVIAMLTSGWSFSIVLILLPTYLNDILHVPSFKNGIINSIIYALFCVASPIIGIVSTRMIETRPFGISRLNIRRLFEMIALIGQVICFIAIPVLGCDLTAVLAVLYSQIVLFSFINGSEVQLATEISVEFAGTIYAIGNSVGSTTGSLVPRVKTFIITDTYNRWQWSLYFYIAAAYSFIGSLLFVVLVRNDVQDFSKDVSQSQMNICESNVSIQDLSPLDLVDTNKGNPSSAGHQLRTTRRPQDSVRPISSSASQM